MATLTVTKPAKAGTAFAPVAASANGDAFANTGKEFLYVDNGGGSPITVTLDCPRACSFGVTNAAHDLAVSINAGDSKLIGTFDTVRFNDDNGLVQVTYSDVTSVLVAVME